MVVITLLLGLTMVDPNPFPTLPALPVVLDDDVSKAFRLVDLPPEHLRVPAVSDLLASFSLGDVEVFGAACEPERFSSNFAAFLLSQPPTEAVYSWARNKNSMCAKGKRKAESDNNTSAVKRSRVMST